MKSQAGQEKRRTITYFSSIETLSLPKQSQLVFAPFNDTDAQNVRVWLLTCASKAILMPLLIKVEGLGSSSPLLPYLHQWYMRISRNRHATFLNGAILTSQVHTLLEMCRPAQPRSSCWGFPQGDLQKHLFLRGGEWRLFGHCYIPAWKVRSGLSVVSLRHLHVLRSISLWVPLVFRTNEKMT